MELNKEMQTQETHQDEVTNKITNLINEITTLKERIGIVEKMCKTFTQQIYKLEESITEIEDNIYDEDEDDEDDE